MLRMLRQTGVPLRERFMKPENKLRLMQYKLEQITAMFVDRAATPETLYQIKLTALKMLEGYRKNPYFNIDVSQDPCDPSCIQITPLNVVTGMLVMGMDPSPQLIQFLGNSTSYTDETGSYWVGYNGGKPVFNFTPKQPVDYISVTCLLEKDSDDSQEPNPGDQGPVALDPPH
jgi:hypothetical protein